MKEFTVSRFSFTHNDVQVWNEFIMQSKNGLFFFNTEFLFYHKDRFEDHSLIIRDNKAEILALFPANQKANVIYSHQGLTFGSLIISNKTKAKEVITIFDAILDYYRQQGIERLIYKAIPYCFHQNVCQEDLYALFRIDARLIRRDISSVLELKNKLEFSQSKKNLVNRHYNNGYKVEEVDNYKPFWNLLSEVLLKFGTKPVHSIGEITLLKSKFPQNIRLFIVKEQEVILAGLVIFEFGHLVHTQYMANSTTGRKLGTLDFINYHLINEIYTDRTYYSFGISTENNGHFLNEGLIQQKELMGARGIAIDTYEITL